jgi:hypothetical protein
MILSHLSISRPLTSAARVLLPLLAATLALVAGACDTTEDPRLLNPPAPDSTLLRVVNLSDGPPIYVSVGAVQVATNVGPMQASAYKPVYFAQRVNIFVTRGDRTDTLTDQALQQGVRVTLFVAARGDRSTILVRQAGTIELQDMIREGLASATFINALPDSTSVTLRSGCQSGPPFMRDVPFGATSNYRDVPVDLSLYLFSGAETSPRTSARLPLQAGTITWLVAARIDGVDRLYAIGPSDAMLRELPQEERSEATVQVLNGLTDGASISASLGADQIASGLGALRLSSAKTVEACRTATGDSLSVTTAGGEILVPLRMDVGSRALAVVYGSESAPHALSLRLDPPPGVPTSAFVRLVNVAANASGARLQIGAGAPDSLALASTFPALPIGGVSGYVALTPGTYPLLLIESGTGRHLAGGLEQLGAGYHTILIVDNGASTDLLVLDHDASSSTLGGLDEPGSRARLFNMMTDGSGSFTIGPISIRDLAYSYTATTVIPRTIATISSNLGDIAIDHSTGSLIVGLTGSGTTRRAISFASPAGSPSSERAAIRILNAVPEAPELSVEFDETVLARYAEPTETVERNAGRFSFTIRAPGDTTVLSRITGVELSGGRRYLLVIGPNRPSENMTEKYRALLVQE